jgi:multisubunit Na+/H+ antiporter MnhB subunit
MPALDLSNPALLIQRLATAFYALVALALFVAVLGAPGIGFVLLVIGACAHVARASLEELAARSTPRAPR